MNYTKNIFYIDWVVQLALIVVSFTLILRHGSSVFYTAIFLGILFISIYGLRSWKTWAKTALFSVLLLTLISIAFAAKTLIVVLVLVFQLWYFYQSSLDSIYLLNRPKSFWDI